MHANARFDILFGFITTARAAVAGLLIGNRGVAYAMSDTTRDHVIKF